MKIPTSFTWLKKITSTRSRDPDGEFCILRHKVILSFVPSSSRVMLGTENGPGTPVLSFFLAQNLRDRIRMVPGTTRE